MMYYYLYKITNKTNGKTYIGVHKTNDLNDGYVGSGKYLKHAIRKYGADNFEKEILKGFDTEEEMFEEEAKVVNEEFVNREDTYNIGCGGRGSGKYINENNLNNHNKNWEEIKRKLSDSSKNMKKPGTSRWLKKQHELGNIEIPNGKGKKHTEETKRKIGEKNSIRQKGKGNSQYGTCGIYNLKLKENKRIKKEDLQYWINKGGIKGVKMKFHKNENIGQSVNE